MPHRAAELPSESSLPLDDCGTNGRDHAPRTAARWAGLWVVLGSSLYLFASLFTLRGTPFLLGGDQVYFWLYAQRMIDGQHVYRDFLQFTPPGTDLVYVAAFRIFGQHPWVLNLVALVLGATFSWLCFWIGRAFLSRWQAMLAAWLFVVVIYGKVLIATHHWYSALAVLGAVAILMPETTRWRIALAGVLLGVAMFFTQTRGPAAFAGFAIYLAWEQRQKERSWWHCSKHLALLFASMCVTWLVLISYFLFTSGPDRISYWLVTYVVRYVAAGFTNLGLPEAADRGHLLSYVQALGVYLAFPVVYATSLWGAWRERHNPAPGNRQRLLLTLTGLAMAGEVAASPNWLRVYCVSAPVFLLLVWAVSRLPKIQRNVVALMWLGLICAVFYETASRYRTQNTVIRLPAGETATDRIAAGKLEWIAQHTRPGDYFFQAAWPGVYLPLQLRNPAFVDALLPTNETRPELVAECLRQLDDKNVRYILWSPRLDPPTLGAPPRTYHLASFREYMGTHYRRITVFPDQDEVWERLQSP